MSSSDEDGERTDGDTRDEDGERTDDDTRRRAFLKGLGAVGATAVAGCLGGSDGGTPTASPPETDTPTGTTTGTGSPGGTVTGTETPETVTEPGTDTPTGGPVFDVRDVSPSEVTVVEGGSATVSVGVGNTGGRTGTRTLVLTTDDETIARQDVSVDAGAETTVTFDLSIAGGAVDLPPGEYIITASIDDAETSGTLAVIERPNIVMLFAEDWNYGTIPDDPVLETPAFDDLAADGVAFSRAFCSAPSCTPSRGSILSGQDFWRNGRAAQLYGPYPSDTPSYPDLLSREADYRIGHTGKGYGPGPGNGAAGPGYGSLNEFLDGSSDDTPFCFWVGPSAAHRDFPSPDIDPAEVTVPPYLPDTDAVREDLAAYYADVTNIDDRIAAVRQTLADAGELENTMFVVTSDHGFAFPRAKTQLYDAGTRVPFVVHWPAAINGGRESEAFVNLTDVAPTFLRAAGIEVPEEMTGKPLLDTLLNPESASRSVDAVFTGMERHVPGQEEGSCGEGYPMRAIRTDEYLYIRNFIPDHWPHGSPDYQATCRSDAWLANADNGLAKYSMYANRDRDDIAGNDRGHTIADLYDLSFAKRPADELYVLADDPHQLNNVAAENPDVVEELRGRLMDELEATGDPRVTEDDPPFYDFQYTGGAPGWVGQATIDQYELSVDPDAVAVFSLDDTLTPGSSTTIEAEVENPFESTLRSVEVTLTPPGDDWQLDATTATAFEELAPGSTERVAWNLAAPEGADGEYTVSGTVAYGPVDDRTRTDVTLSVTVFTVDGPPSEGLETYYSLDESTLPPADGVTGTEAVVTGSPTTGESGIRDTAFGFSINGNTSDDKGPGAADALTTGEDLPLNGTGGTVGAWFRFVKHEKYARFCQVGSTVDGLPSNGWDVEFDDTTDDLKLVLWDQGSLSNSPTVTLTPDTWYFVVAVVGDGGTARLHVFDETGELDPSPVTMDDTRDRTDGDRLHLMAGDGGDVDGRMDEVYAYSRALSEDQIAELYAVSTQ
jgi:arylsulfatase A-like enzyme